MKKSLILSVLFLMFFGNAFAAVHSVPQNEISGKKQIVINENTNLYSEPSTSSAVLFTPKVGEELLIISVTDSNFCKVLYNKKNVYVNSADISDTYETATFFGNNGSYATKLYSMEITYPKTIPAKSARKALKAMSPEEQSLFNNGTSIASSEKGKPYKTGYFYYPDNTYERRIEFSNLIEKYFPELAASEQISNIVTRLDIYATYTNQNSTKTIKESFYNWDISDVTVYSKEFDGNTVIGYKDKNDILEDETLHYLKLFTVDKDFQSSEVKLIKLLEQPIKVAVAMQNDNYVIIMPQDFRGVKNQIHCILYNDEYPQNYTYEYKYNRFIKRCNFGIVNKDSITVRNKASLDGAKITGTLKQKTEVTVYDVLGSGKVIGNVLDLWYKIAEHEEKYVNATAINLYPFYLYCYNYEEKDYTGKLVNSSYIPYDAELFFDTTLNYYSDAIRAENVEWLGKNPTIVEMFCKNLWYDTCSKNEFGAFDCLSVEENGYFIPFGITLGTKKNIITQIFGTPGDIKEDGSVLSSLVYYTYFDDQVFILTLKFNDEKLESLLLSKNQ